MIKLLIFEPAWDGLKNRPNLFLGEYRLIRLAIVLDGTYQGQFKLPEGGLRQESDRGR